MLTNVIKLWKQILKLASISTDKGELTYDGELEVGKEVYVEKDGEYVAAEDGEYATEEKVIVVADGKISEIKDKEEEPKEDEPVVEEPAQLSAEEKFNAKRIEMAASYQTVQENIYKALDADGVWAYILENTDDYAIVSVWEDNSEKLYKYNISVAEDGAVSLGEREEVKVQYVPVNAPAEEESEEDVALQEANARIAELESQIELQKKQLEMSVDEPAKEKVKQVANEDTRLYR